MVASLASIRHTRAIVGILLSLCRRTVTDQVDLAPLKMSGRSGSADVFSLAQQAAVSLYLLYFCTRMIRAAGAVVVHEPPFVASRKAERPWEMTALGWSRANGKWTFRQAYATCAVFQVHGTATVRSMCRPFGRQLPSQSPFLIGQMG